MDLEYYMFLHYVYVLMNRESIRGIVILEEEEEDNG